MPRLYRNFLAGVLEASLSSSGTTLTSSAFANLPVIASPDTMTLVLDPAGNDGAPEIVVVTAHGEGATTVTVTRAQQGTSSRSHALGTDWFHSVTRQDIEDLIEPAGIIKAYAGDTAPPGHLFCDGSEVSRTTYARLFTAIGTRFGSGNGTTTFNVPDLRGLGIFFLGSSAPFNTLGATGGSKDAIVPAHTHTINHDHPSTSTSTAPDHTHSINHDHPAATTSSDNALDEQHISAAAGNLDLPANQGLNNVSVAGRGDHSHTFNVPAYTGTSGNGGSHSHSVNLPNFEGVSGSTGQSATNANLPPYMVLNAIITI